MIVDIIIPAYNEEGSIALVVEEIPRALVRDILVCDNASTDRTAKNAAAAGAKVIFAPEKGYGNACLAGLRHIAIRPADEHPEIVAFIDGDLSDYPAQLGQLLAPIKAGEADLVIGSRALGNRQAGAMLPHQIFGNWLATTLIRLIWGVKFTDLGPFRAISKSALDKIGMEDKNFGWTVEMQVKAAKLGLKCVEVPVDYRNRLTGASKVSGNLKNSYLAGQKILWTIFSNL